MRHSILPVLLFISVSVQAQQHVAITAANADCSNPIEIKDTILIAENSPIGFGSDLEIDGNAKDDTCFFEKEHNTVWYWFKIKADGVLSFTITPQKRTDDYDFALYKSEGRTFCTDVKSKKILPLRTCISRNYETIKGATGLNNNAAENYIHSGVGASFVKSLEVKKGEYYYLVLDNVYDKGSGHKIEMHYDYPQKINLAVGASFTLKNIQFYAGQDVFLPTAKPALDTLLSIIQKHPVLKIEIQGHVNGPGEQNTFILQDLSERRAIAVFKFLSSNKIKPERLSRIGFGNSKMLFPNPQNETEASANRRVEIKIVGD
ncbi:MAG: OmpA family protein [Bacteroidia bacterium]